MGLGIVSLASSSSGNSYLLKSENTNILLDVGISLKRIKDIVSREGLELADISGILITHEHIDHVKSLKSLIKKAENANIYMSAGTLEGLKEKYGDLLTPLLTLESEGRLKLVNTAEVFLVGDISVSAFNISHDTKEPIAYTFEKDGKVISVVTDTGYISDEIYESIKDSDSLIIESNHEKNILLYGRYPYMLKQRILSDLGHLSNDTTAETIVRMLKELNGKKIPKIYLAHISKENNTEEQALITVTNALEEAGFYVGKDLRLSVLKKEEASDLLQV